VSLALAGHAESDNFSEGIDSLRELQIQSRVAHNERIEVRHHAVALDERAQIEVRVERRSNHVPFVANAKRCAKEVPGERAKVLHACRLGPQESLIRYIAGQVRTTDHLPLIIYVSGDIAPELARSTQIAEVRQHAVLPKQGVSWEEIDLEIQIIGCTTTRRANGHAVIIDPESEPLLVAGKCRELLVRRTLAGIDPEQAVAGDATLGELIEANTARHRFNMILLLWFAVCATVLAGMGIYGVVAETIIARKREIAIRMALGAPRTGVVRGIVFKTLRFAVLEEVLGLCAVVLLYRQISEVLYGAAKYGLVLLGVVVVLVFTVSFCASFWPAWAAVDKDSIDLAQRARVLTCAVLHKCTRQALLRCQQHERRDEVFLTMYTPEGTLLCQASAVNKCLWNDRCLQNAPLPEGWISVQILTLRSGGDQGPSDSVTHRCKGNN
jgi:hypothetical protein